MSSVPLAAPRMEAAHLEREEQTECAICFEDFKEGENKKTLDACKHVFHTSCISEWFDRSKKTDRLTFETTAPCPMCRKKFTLDPAPRADIPRPVRLNIPGLYRPRHAYPPVSAAHRREAFHPRPAPLPRYIPAAHRRVIAKDSIIKRIAKVIFSATGMYFGFRAGLFVFSITFGGCLLQASALKEAMLYSVLAFDCIAGILIGKKAANLFNKIL
jgi:hypothetical protein